MNAIEQAKMKRLQDAVVKLADWSGNDISELIEDGMLGEGDLDA